MTTTTSNHSVEIGRLRARKDAAVPRQIKSPRGGIERWSRTNTDAATQVQMAAEISRPLGLTDDAMKTAVGVATTATAPVRSGEDAHRQDTASANANNAAQRATLTNRMRYRPAILVVKSEGSPTTA